MAVLGFGGKLVFKREAPNPVLISADAIDLASNALQASGADLWNGDQVQISSARGLPFNLTLGGLPDPSGAAIPDCPDGYAFYAGSKWLAGGARTHVTSNTSKFYKLDNAAPFYVRIIDVGFVDKATFFIYRDQLDRISFYLDRSSALRGKPADRVPIYLVDFGQLALTYQDSDDWNIEAGIQEWTFELESPDLDATALGERFSDAVKGLISGSGSLDFQIDRTELVSGQDTTGLLNLLLLTEKGCKSQAEFWIIAQRLDTNDQRLPGDLFYEATILTTKTAVNTRPDALVAGSATFVTVGEVHLRMGET